jgi:hypothetical protein
MTNLRLLAAVFINLPVAPPTGQPNRAREDAQPASARSNFGTALDRERPL